MGILENFKTILDGIDNAGKALSTPQGRQAVKTKLIAGDKIEAASTLDDMEEILDAAAEVGAEME